jgi:hypothetical protein
MGIFRDVFDLDFGSGKTRPKANINVLRMIFPLELLLSRTLWNHMNNMKKQQSKILFPWPQGQIGTSNSVSLTADLSSI